MDKFRIRGNIILVFVGLIMTVFVVRLFNIQILNKEYRGAADKRVKKRKIIVPPRGDVYDRKGRTYVTNTPVFDMRITPRELTIEDTTILCKHLDMERSEVRSLIQKARDYSPYQESLFAQYIEPRVYSVLEEITWDYGGVSFYTNNKRTYNYQVGANFLGYIGEVNSEDISSATKGTYMLGDMIGKSGIERNFDTLLRGDKGIHVVIKDKLGREVGSFAEGSIDKRAVRGKDLLLGIDVELQQFGEELMQNKVGSIVAIEPRTGEILAFVSAPTYNPQELTGKDFRRKWRELDLNPLLPLYNRPLMATYPPGSIFKIPVALAALQEGVITPDRYYSCGGAFWRNKGKPGCRFHVHPLNLKNAIRLSCNSYFAATYVDFLNHEGDIYKGFKNWTKYMSSMGIGQEMGVDLPYERTGILPTSDMYDNPKRWYGANKWNASTTISNSIGQGEVLMTPLQMANLAAIVANRGWYIPPHFVRAYRDNQDHDWVRIPGYEQKNTLIDRKYYELMVDAMEAVVKNGTAPRAYIDPSLPVCGKTGTAQNPHGQDHSVFMGFAPKDNPRIAVAVIIENAGGGGTWAAPTAALMIEKFLRGSIEVKKYEEARVSKANFIKYKKGS